MSGFERIARFLLLLALLPVAGMAADDAYEQGRAAYREGRYVEAFQIWEPLAERGHSLAQFSVGNLYFAGRGVTQDQSESARWFRRAAEQGFAPAQFNLGNAYKNGHGVVQDDVAATRWWRAAAEQNFAPAQYNLGTQYYFGRGVSRDTEQALEWYRRAAANGHERAQAILGQVTAEQAEAATAPSRAPSRQPEQLPPVLKTEEPDRDAVPEPPEMAVQERPQPPPPPEPPPRKAPARAEAQPPAPAAPAPAPAAPAGGVHREDWLLAQAPGHYALQLMATRKEKGVKEFIRDRKLGDDAAYFRFSKGGEPWYAVVYGAYPSRAAANAVAGDMPRNLRGIKPWVRSFASIQKVIRAAP